MPARRVLAIALSLLIGCPLWAGSESVGAVASSQSAFVGGASAVPGSTVFTGDKISIGPHGNAWISLAGGSQVLLDENTQARLLRSDNTVQLEVNQGRATFRSTPSNPIEGLVEDATFRPVKNFPAAGTISFPSANTAFFFARQGDWVISTTHDGTSLLLHQGQGIEARVEQEPADQSSTTATTPPAKKRRRALVVILAGGVIIGSITAAAIAANQGEATLSTQQKQNAVSPFQFP